MKRLCLIHGYANLLKDVVDEVISDRNRTRFDDIYLLKCDQTQNVSSEKSTRGENIVKIPTQVFYSTNPEKKLPDLEEKHYEGKDLILGRSDDIHKYFGEFTILCDRAGIHKTSQMEKLQLFDRLVMYFNKLFDNYDNVFIYSDSVPHYPVEYILDKVSDYKTNCDRYYSHDTTLANYFFITKRLEDKLYPELWVQQNNSKLHNAPIAATEWIIDYLSYLQLQTRKDGRIVNSSGSLADFANSLNEKSKVISSLGKTRYNDIFRNMIDEIAINAECKKTWNSGLLMYGSEPISREKIRRIYEEYIDNAFDMQDYYNEICISIEKTKKLLEDSIYIPLHFQPERSTCPDGGNYANQILFIKKIREKTKLPILVKEHPTQIIQSFPNPQTTLSRNKQFYDEIIGIKDTHLISLEVQQNHLIRDARLIATVTGTSGWQALSIGKKTIYGGYPWYGSHKNAYFIDEVTSIDDLDCTINTSKLEAIEQTLEFFDKIKDVLHRAGFHETESENNKAIVIHSWREAIIKTMESINVIKN